MTSFFKLLPVAAALAATPALAQTADPHAGHHPAAATTAAPAKPDAKADDAQGCPMMKGQMTGGQMMGGQMMGDGMKGGAGQMDAGMGAGGMMAGGDHMQHCMMSGDAKASAAPAAKPDAKGHDHQHQ